MDTKKIMKVGVGLAAAGLGIIKLLRGNVPRKYSDKWFATASDEELNSEREIVRRQYCSVENDILLADGLQNRLRRFDFELNKRAWGGETPRGPGYSREHGRNLYKKE